MTVTLAVTLRQEEMLPRNFPKFGGYLVNRAAKFSRIELDVQVHGPRCPALSAGQVWFPKKYLCVQGRVGMVSLGCIIPFDGSIANAFFGNQFERWLKEVDVEP